MEMTVHQCSMPDISSLFRRKHSMQELFWLFYRLNKMVFSVKSINFFGTWKTEREEKRKKKEVGKGHLRVRL